MCGQLSLNIGRSLPFNQSCVWPFLTTSDFPGVDNWLWLKEISIEPRFSFSENAHSAQEGAIQGSSLSDHNCTHSKRSAPPWRIRQPIPRKSCGHPDDSKHLSMGKCARVCLAEHPLRCHEPGWSPLMFEFLEARPEPEATLIWP